MLNQYFSFTFNLLKLIYIKIASIFFLIILGIFLSLTIMSPLLHQYYLQAIDTDIDACASLIDLEPKLISFIIDFIFDGSTVTLSPTLKTPLEIF